MKYKLKYKCPFCRKRVLGLRALKVHIKSHSSQLMALTKEEYEIYLELRRRGLNPCFPSYIRQVTNYKWSIERCQGLLRKIGCKRELGYNLRQLILVHQGNGFVIVKVIE